jgi:hypothetical protein
VKANIDVPAGDPPAGVIVTQLPPSLIVTV